MRSITFKVPKNVYSYMQEFESEILKEPQFNIQISNAKPGDYGLVCLSCGNRGDSAPIEMTGYTKAHVYFTKDGELQVEMDMEAVRKRFEETLTFEYWGMGTFGPNSISNASGELFRCLNCNSGVILLAELALESCHNRGCSGCFVCNKYDTHEDVLDFCANCQIAMDIMMEDIQQRNEPIDDTLNRSCEEIDCPTLFARQSAYNIKVDDILTRMRMLL